MKEYFIDGRRRVKLDEEDIELAKMFYKEIFGPDWQKTRAVIKMFRDAGKSIGESCDIVSCAKEALGVF